MELDAEYSIVREKLYALGFDQHLPLGSLGIVSALLDDLIKTTSNLKRLNESNKKLLEEKVAWNLGTEPYKCDNSKLIAECNGLHLELIRQRDEYRMKIIELDRDIRNLECDKQYLEEHCTELGNKIKELEIRLVDSKINGVGGGVNGGSNRLIHRKPFLSTVRSNAEFPPLLNRPQSSTATTHGGGGSSDDDTNLVKCAKCIQLYRDGHNNGGHVEVKKLQNEIKTQANTLLELQKQIESRDREIGRLQKLLVGGRPAAALGRDCCYRGFDTLSDDVNSLQKEKLVLKSQLQECVKQQHEAMQRAMRTATRANNMEKDLAEMERVALSVESEANHNIAIKDEKIAKLEKLLNDRIKDFALLEADKSNSKIANDLENDRMNFSCQKKLAEHEISNLKKELKRVTENHQESLEKYEKLNQKNHKLKQKITELTKEKQYDVDEQQLPLIVEVTAPKNTTTVDDNTMKQISNYKLERDYYQNEYIKLLNKPTYEKEFKEIEIELNNLKKKYNAAEKLHVEKLNLLMSQYNADANGGGGNGSGTTGGARNETNTINGGYLSNRSVQSTINRVEREKDILRTELQCCMIERDDLRHRLKDSTELQQNQQNLLDKKEQDLIYRLTKLENDNRLLNGKISPNETTIKLLRTEVAQLKDQLQELKLENSKLKTNYHQVKILQNQAEIALVDHQNRLSHTANQLGHAETRLTSLDTGRDKFYQEISDLKAEISVLKSINLALEAEKDQLVIDLDIKTERAYGNEGEANKLRILNKEMEIKINGLYRQIDDIKIDSHHKEGTIRKTSNETEALRKQNLQLQRFYENSMAEQRRLENEVSDLTTDQSETRKQLRTSEKEVNRLKNQLQQYVQEVEKAENLLIRKEEERDEMLEHYKTLSHDAVVLEGTNHSLEVEASEAKRSLVEAETKIAELHEYLSVRNNETNSYDRHVAELSHQIAIYETELEQQQQIQKQLTNDLNATKELCSKLDHQRDKINDELNECSEIRRTLEMENEKLRNGLTVSKTSDQAKVNSLQELLSAARSELEQQRTIVGQQKKEIEKLRLRIDELQNKLSEECANAARNDTLAREYNVQIQELRQRLTNDRFSKTKISPPAGSTNNNKESRDEFDRPRFFNINKKNKDTIQEIYNFCHNKKTKKIGSNTTSSSLDIISYSSAKSYINENDVDRYSIKTYSTDSQELNTVSLIPQTSIINRMEDDKCSNNVLNEIFNANSDDDSSHFTKIISQTLSAKQSEIDSFLDNVNAINDEKLLMEIIYDKDTIEMDNNTQIDCQTKNISQESNQTICNNIPLKSIEVDEKTEEYIEAKPLGLVNSATNEVKVQRKFIRFVEPLEIKSNYSINEEKNQIKIETTENQIVESSLNDDDFYSIHSNSTSEISTITDSGDNCNSLKPKKINFNVSNLPPPPPFYGYTHQKHKIQSVNIKVITNFSNRNSQFPKFNTNSNIR